MKEKIFNYKNLFALKNLFYSIKNNFEEKLK